MKEFYIGDQFYLDGEPFKILSGAIHYFRVHPDDWYHSLYNLKALGFNTVETYVLGICMSLERVSFVTRVYWILSDF